MAKINGSRLRILSLFVILKSLSEVLVDALNSPMYEFGVDCFTRHEGLIKNTTIFVRYDGKPVVNSSVCQYYAFELAEDTSGSHKMCVTPLYFIDPDCDVQLDIKSSYSGSSLHTIDCNTETNDDFCADENKDDLYIFFKKHGVIASTNATLLLQVYVEEVDHSAVLWIIIGSLLGAIVFFTACACVICRRKCKRKKARGRVLNSAQPNAGSAVNQPAFPFASYMYSTQAGNPSTAVNQPAYPYASYSTQAGDPVTNLYPVGNYPTQYSMGTNSQPQYQHSFQRPPQTALYEEPEKVPSSPPPSYDQVNE